MWPIEISWFNIHIFCLWISNDLSSTSLVSHRGMSSGSWLMGSPRDDLWWREQEEIQHFAWFNCWNETMYWRAALKNNCDTLLFNTSSCELHNYTYWRSCFCIMYEHAKLYDALQEINQPNKNILNTLITQYSMTTGSVIILHYCFYTLPIKAVSFV